MTKRSRTTILIVVGALILVVGGTMVLGLFAVEEQVAMKAEDLNEFRGSMVDANTRFDGAEANGTTLLSRYTILDRVLDGLSPQVRAHLPDAPTLEDLWLFVSEGALRDACTVRKEFVFSTDVVVVHEYRDERGAVVGDVRGDANNCGATG